MPKSDKASILAVGTELTTGQVTNRNAAWISERLADLGVETVLHETVADDRQMIRSALDRCKSLSGLILVTGGLGPTTDDFTREVIADWLGKPLRFYEPSWRKINERLSRLGVPVAESNRQQAYYPETAQVIVNDLGTADAFCVPCDAACLLWALPGPPREVEAVWGPIQAQIRAHVPHLRPLKLLTWQCIGKSEAELGELTEAALAGSQLKIGYRAYRPYVEVKVWCADEDMRTKAPYFEKLERAIGPWVAARGGEDLAARLLELIARTEEVAIADSCTGGVLAERLGALLRNPAHATQADGVVLSTEWTSLPHPEQWVRQVLAEADPVALTLAIAGFNDAGEWCLGMREGSLNRVETGRWPYGTRPTPELYDRAKRYATELALKRWCEWLQGTVQ